MKERDALTTRQKAVKEAVRALQGRLASLNTTQLSFELDSIVSLLERGEPLRPLAAPDSATGGDGVRSLESVEQSIEHILAGLGRPTEKPKPSSNALDQELAALMGK